MSTNQCKTKELINNMQSYCGSLRRCIFQKTHKIHRCWIKSDLAFPLCKGGRERADLFDLSILNQDSLEVARYLKSILRGIFFFVKILTLFL